MNTLLYSIVLMLALTSAQVYSQAPTKVETEEWLNGRLSIGDFSYTVFSQGKVFYKAYESQTFEVKDCDCKMTELYYDEAGPTARVLRTTLVSTFNFRQITSANVAPLFKPNSEGVYSSPTIRYLNLKTFNNESAINVSKNGTSSMQSIVSITIPFDLEEERVLKAITHYIELCGGRKEKF